MAFVLDPNAMISSTELANRDETHMIAASSFPVVGK
jgi:hypothetical protein